jgi:uncharacterized protein (DUF305 family)
MSSIYRATPLVLALAAALQLSTTACATSAPMAQTPTEVAAQGTSLPTMDQQFLGEAGKFSAKSIELARLAKGSAADSELRAFAGYLESQHIEINRGIESVAGGVRAFGTPSTVPGGQHGDATQGDNVAPSTPTASNDPDMARLVTLSGPAFDRAWVQLMIERHPEAILAYRNAEQHGQSEVRAIASRDLVVIRRHLQQLETFDKRLPVIAGE